MVQYRNSTIQINRNRQKHSCVFIVHHLIFFQPKSALTEKKKGKGIERKIDPKSENKRNHTLLEINQDTISYSKKKHFTNLNKL